MFLFPSTILNASISISTSLSDSQLLWAKFALKYTTILTSKTDFLSNWRALKMPAAPTSLFSTSFKIIHVGWFQNWFYFLLLLIDDPVNTITTNARYQVEIRKIIFRAKFFLVSFRPLRILNQPLIRVFAGLSKQTLMLYVYDTLFSLTVDLIQIRYALIETQNEILHKGTLVNV